MKKIVLALGLLCVNLISFADKYNYNFNFCVIKNNDVVEEKPMDVTIQISKDEETQYNMCYVTMNGKNMAFKITSGIIRDQVYPNLALLEMDVVPTSRKWFLKFIGDRVLFYRFGGTRYTFKNANWTGGVGASSAAKENVELESGDEAQSGDYSVPATKTLSDEWGIDWGD